MTNEEIIKAAAEAGTVGNWGLGEWQRMANAILLTLSESKKLWKNGNEYNLIEYYKKEFLIDF